MNKMKVKSGLLVLLAAAFALATTGCVFIGDTIPSAPNMLKPEQIYYDTVRISWRSVSGATSYKLYWSNIAYGTYSEFGAEQIYGTSYDVLLPPSSTYYFKVSAVNSAGESDKSIHVEATNGSYSGALSAPTGINAWEKDSYGTIRVSWNEVYGASYYKLYWSTNSSSGYTLVSGAGSISHTYFDVTISSGHTYYFKVSAVKSSGAESEKSGYTWITTSGSSHGQLNAPTNVNATALSKFKINVSWNYVPGATSYKVYYAYGIGSSYTKWLAGTVNDNGVNTSFSFTHDWLYSNTKYYYYVTAVNNYGESVYSNYSYATTWN